MYGRWSSRETTRMFTNGTDRYDSIFKLENDRLRVLMTDTHDFFAAEISYHKKCYSYLEQIRNKRYSKEETKILNERKACKVYAMKKKFKI